MSIQSRLTRIGGKLAQAATSTPARLPRLRGGSLEQAVGDRVVLITGASSGIGRATALRVGAAGGKVVLVARTREKLEEVAAEITEVGGEAYVHPADLSDLDDIARMADEVIAEHGGVDVLVNNAGHSIRRSIHLSYERIHDFERTIQLNYLGAVQLILKLMPGMRERGGGHIINISSMGVQTNTPRFSAYVASKAALDAFSRVIAAEVLDDGVRVTTVHMPLVRTPMIKPTKHYRYFPSISPDQAAAMITDAMIGKPKDVSTPFGRLSTATYATVPRVQDALANRAYKLFPDSNAARAGASDGSAKPAAAESEETEDKGTAEQRAFARLTGGTHW
jgi:NAD(P)-dependent dehydrogenase (short-subunit alcohol dehydrogenase family)